MCEVQAWIVNGAERLEVPRVYWDEEGRIVFDIDHYDAGLKATPSADGSRLNYQMTVTDPAAFLEPAELELYWIYVPGVTVEPYECAEG